MRTRTSLALSRSARDPRYAPRRPASACARARPKCAARPLPDLACEGAGGAAIVCLWGEKLRTIRNRTASDRVSRLTCQGDLPFARLFLSQQLLRAAQF